MQKFTDLDEMTYFGSDGADPCVVVFAVGRNEDDETIAVGGHFDNVQGV